MIPAVVLAAGRSSRMGRPKAALELPGDTTFLGRLLASLDAAGAAPLVVVTGPDRDAVTGAVREPLRARVRFVANPEPDRGQLSSMQCGLAAVETSAPAAVVALVDVPIVQPDTVRRLVERWAASGEALVRPSRGARHGHPFVVGRALIDALLAAPSDTTARHVIAPWLPGLDVEVEDEGPFEDVDTPEEYERLVRRIGR